MADENKDVIKFEKKLLIVRKNTDNIRSVPVNDLAITHSANELFLTFSTIEPPLILDMEDLDKTTEIEGIVRAKFVISLTFAEAIVKTLSKEINAYKQGGGGLNVNFE